MVARTRSPGGRAEGKGVKSELIQDVFLYFCFEMTIESQEDAKSSTETSHLPFTPVSSSGYNLNIIQMWF